MEEKKLMKAFTSDEMTELATIWKGHKELLQRLVDSVIYNMTIEECESKREKELIKKVAQEQNNILEGFYLLRNQKTK